MTNARIFGDTGVFYKDHVPKAGKVAFRRMESMGQSRVME